MSASPDYESFFIINNTTGNPATGLAGSFAFNTYKDSSGGSISPPSVVEIGGGEYGFIPVFADPSKGITYTLQSPSGTSPAWFSRYMRPEDFTQMQAIKDDTQRIKVIQEGKRFLFSTGPNADTEICYDTDGTSTAQQFATVDKNGNPTSTDPIYGRTPMVPIP